MKTHLIRLVPQDKNDPEGLTRNVLIVEEAMNYRFGIGFVPEGKSGRQYYGGPQVPGPWAYAYGMATIIDCHGGSAAREEALKEAGLLTEAEIGDILDIDGILHRLKLHPDRYNIILEKL